MTVYICLMFLALALVTLMWGNSSDGPRKPIYFGVGFTLVAAAAAVFMVAAIRSLWLYPLN